MPDSPRQQSLDEAQTPPEFPWRRWLHAGIAFVLLAVVLVVLQRELDGLRMREVLAYFRSVPADTVAWAIVLTILSYLLLCAFDLLGLRYIRKRVPVRRILFTSFLAYAISHNVGAGAITGGAIRYRLYSGCGLRVVDVATLQGFCSLTTVLGLTLLFGIALLLNPEYASIALPLRRPWTDLLGTAVLALVMAYMAWGHYGRRVFTFRSWTLWPPGESTALLQICLGVAELSAKAAALWFLLPPQAHIGFTAFLGAYALAVSAGIVSYIPGGLGIFESVMLLSLPAVSSSVLLGALLMYRIVYQLMPLGLAGCVIATNEIRRRNRRGTA